MLASESVFPLSVRKEIYSTVGHLGEVRSWVYFRSHYFLICIEHFMVFIAVPYILSFKISRVILVRFISSILFWILAKLRFKKSMCQSYMAKKWCVELSICRPCFPLYRFGFYYYVLGKTFLYFITANIFYYFKFYFRFYNRLPLLHFNIIM